MSVPLSIRVAAILMWLTAVGFGLCSLPTLRNVGTGRDLPILFGFRAFGGGAFERYGPRFMLTMLALFLLVCVAEGIAGSMVWNGERLGAFIALALVPIGATFWWG